MISEAEHKEEHDDQDFLVARWCAIFMIACYMCKSGSLDQTSVAQRLVQASRKTFLLSWRSQPAPTMMMPTMRAIRPPEPSSDANLRALLIVWTAPWLSGRRHMRP